MPTPIHALRGARVAALAWWLLLACCLLASGAASAAVRAWLDRDTVAIGETVTLNVESSDADAEIDFSVLRDQFELLGTSSRTQVQMTATGRNVSALRAVALQPRRTGQLVIPALQVGNESTQPLALTVQAAPVATGAERDVFLEVEMEPRDPYVQQQVRYTLRLYYAVTLLEGQLEEPAAANVQVRRLGQDSTDQRSVDGRRYNVVERHYALIPERSGALEVPAAVFRGRAILPGRRSTWIGAGAPVAAQGEAAMLDVRPRPDGASEPWLPAAELVLEDASGELPDSVRVGEPLTLSLRARARGLGAAQLPELVLPAIEGAQVYPDQPALRDGNDGPWLLGERERRFAIVPSQPGTLRIPALELQWWDTRTGESRRASVPARSIEVLPAAGAEPADASTATAPGDPAAAADAGGTWWRWLAAGFALLWLATLAWAVSRRRARPRSQPPRAQPAGPEPVQRKAARARLRTALAGGELGELAAALLGLARSEGLALGSLGALADAVADPGQRDALRAIETARYGNGDAGAALAAARAAFGSGTLALARRSARVSDDPLPPLYPR